MYPTKKLWEICEIKTWRKDANYSTEDWLFPFFTCWREILKAPWYSFDTDAILIAWNWDVWACKKYKWKFEAYQRTYVLDNFKDIYKNFLFYFLDWNLRRELLTETLWSAIPYIKLGSLKNREIPLPPLSTQKLIVEKLDMIFAEIEKSKNLLEKNLQNVDEMNKSVLEKIFANDKRERKKLGEVCDFNYWKAFPAWAKNITGNFPVYWANGIMYMWDNFLIDAQSIIVGRKWSVGALTKTSGKFWVSDVAYYVIEKQNTVLDFLYYFLKKSNLQQFARGVKPGLNRNEVYNLKIPLPPLETQKLIVEKLDNIFAENQKLKNLYQAQIKNLDEMKQSFLKKAFAGELV